MKNYTAAAIALGDRTKQTARNLGLDVNSLASRHVVERIVSEINLRVPVRVTGGLMFAQTLRETKDADLLTIRRISNREMQNAFKVLAPYLAHEGIVIHSLSPEPREMHVGLPNVVDRWKFEASCGTIRANSHLDITWCNGPQSTLTLAAAPKWLERPSLIKGAKPFGAYAQPFSTVAAEKLLAVIMQPESDLRCKHLADIVHADLWPFDMDCRMVAHELRRTLSLRGIPMSVAAERPEGLRWPKIARLEADWNKNRNAQRTGLTLDQAWIDVNAIWSDVHAELRNMVIEEVRRPDYKTRYFDRLIAAEAPVCRLKPAIAK